MADDKMPSWSLIYSVNDGEQSNDLSNEARKKADRLSTWKYKVLT